ncbi:MAG: hypothetical protein AB7E55_34260, partial [Pigmentiphaga sp.]
PAAVRTLRAGTRAPWSRSRLSRSAVVALVTAISIRDSGARSPWGIATAQRCDARSSWAVAGTADHAGEIPWSTYAARAICALPAVWRVANTADRYAVLPWGRYGGRPFVDARPGWSVSRAADLSAVVPWQSYGPRHASLDIIVTGSAPADGWWVLPWVRYSRPLNPGWGVVIDPGGPPVDENGTIIVPIRSTYIVLNTVSLVIADTGEPIQHSGLSLQLDVDSWAWGWSATVPASYLTTLRPSGEDGFVEVVATINGEPFRLVIETLQRDRRFGRSDLKIGGRGRSAWLAAPHSPTITRYNTESRTAQQLLEDALTTNGVSIGWAVDWQVTDWLVPAGAWSYQGSYIDAAVRIAEAAGAVVQPHPMDQTLRILHRYPATPWEWPDATPDIALPEDVVTVEGITWSDKPRYDAVYVAGSILGHVTRTGTSGGVVAPMVTDALVTEDVAARQRGRAILSDTGRQAQIRLSLPVLEETGIIQPGALIQYTEQGVVRLGLARAVDVQCGWPAVNQTVTVETHEL